MRYYEIFIDGKLKYSSLRPDGSSNPRALQVEFDFNIGYNDTLGQGSYVTVYGIPLSDVSQQTKFFGKSILVRGGMSKGLPLANPDQAGVLCRGQIYQALGNWVGTNCSISFVISPSSSVPTGGGPNPQQPPTPIVLNWKRGTDLRQALQTALSQAFPAFKLNIAIGRYIAPSDQVGFHHDLEGFGYFLRRYTQSLGGPGSEGVGITLHDGTLSVLDGSQPQGRGQLAYQDLIGQPTWLKQNTITIPVRLRGDLRCGQKVTLPRTAVTNTFDAGYVSPNAVGSIAPATSLTFQGTFTVQGLRHIGHSRNPGGDAWVTAITATVDAGQPLRSGAT